MARLCHECGCRLSSREGGISRRRNFYCGDCRDSIARIKLFEELAVLMPSEVTEQAVVAVAYSLQYGQVSQVCPKCASNRFGVRMPGCCPDCGYVDHSEY